MSFFRAIRKLNNSQNFVSMLDSRLKELSRELGIHLEYNDQVAREIAQQWRQILRTNFDFHEADFNLLIDEVIGELVGTIAATPKLLRPVTAQSNDFFIRTVISYLPEYLALDIAVTILKRVLRRENIARPTPQRILDACMTLRQSPEAAYRYWSWLGLRSGDS